MSLFAKIMVVVNLVLAVAFLAAAGTLLGAMEDWKGRYATDTGTLKEDKAALEQQVSQRDDQLNNLRDAKTAVETELSAKSALVQQLQDSNRTLNDHNTSLGTDAGSAVVYVDDGTSWVELMKLEDPSGMPQDRFGLRVALDGYTLVVGSYWDDVGGTIDSGSICVFDRNDQGTPSDPTDDTWVFHQKLTPSIPQAGAWFGLDARPGFAFGDAARGAVLRPAATRGTGGYLPERDAMDAGFVAWGRGIRTGVRIPHMRLVDVAPTVARLMGLDLGEVDGRVLIGALEPPPDVSSGAGAEGSEDGGGSE